MFVAFSCIIRNHTIIYKFGAFFCLAFDLAFRCKDHTSYDVFHPTSTYSYHAAYVRPHSSMFFPYIHVFAQLCSMHLVITSDNRTHYKNCWWSNKKNEKEPRSLGFNRHERDKKKTSEFALHSPVMRF